MAICTPFGLMPVRSTRLDARRRSSCRCRFPCPGVMFGAVTLNGGSSQDSPPENSLAGDVAGRALRRMAVAAGHDAVDQIVAALDQIGLRIGGSDQRRAQASAKSAGRIIDFDSLRLPWLLRMAGVALILACAGARADNRINDAAWRPEVPNQKGGAGAPPLITRKVSDADQAAAVASSAAFFSCTGPESLPLAVDVAVDEFDHRHRRRCRRSGSRPSGCGCSRRCGPCSAGRARRTAS